MKDRAMSPYRISDAWLTAESYWRPSWMLFSAWLEHAPFASWLLAAHRPRSIVELGTHTGFSYFTWCEGIARLGLDTRTWAVDSWQGDEHAGFYDEDVFTAVSHENDQYRGFSTLLRGYFADMVSTFADRSIDLLHVDGRHRYEDVKEDFEAYAPKLSDRAIVLFHDVAERRDDFGVYRYWEELTGRNLHSFEFHHGHGLGVLCVGEETNDAMRSFFAASRDQGDLIRSDYARLGAVISDEQRTRERAGSVAGLEALVRGLESSGRATTQERDALAAELADLRRTVSWRITRPLRAVRRVGRRA